MGKKELALRIIRTVTGFILLGLLFYWIPLPRLYNIFPRLSWTPLIIVLFISFSVMLISITKLFFILNSTNKDFPFTTVFTAYYLGIFFNNFIPTSVGGDLIKIYRLNKSDNGPLSLIGAAVGMERFSGILALIIIGTYSFVSRPELYKKMGTGIIGTGKFWGIMTALGVITILGLKFIHTKLSSKKQASSLNSPSQLQSAFYFPKQNLRVWTIILGSSLVFHLLRGVNFILVTRAFGEKLFYSHALALLPIIALGGFLPISLGGIGVREGIITFCLKGLGYPLEVGLGISLIFRIITVIHSMFGCCLYFLQAESFLPKNKSLGDFTNQTTTSAKQSPN